MSFKNIMRDLRDVKGGLGCSSRRGMDVKYWLHRSRSYIAPDVAPPNEVVEQGQWANLPPELLLDIIQRVEKSETSWPARRVVVFCASVCKSWREVTKEIVKTPEECGRLTFPISLKQVILLDIAFWDTPELKQNLGFLNFFSRGPHGSSFGNTIKRG
ncbi:hypothetical protein Leryth_025096 [Lithospermum erythrorhizon]|nr:hypothetical protein Leryth_025096 [Lithospermum erythrorhizon]